MPGGPAVEAAPFIVFCAILVMLAVSTLVVGPRRRRMRRSELQQWAAAHGWTSISPPRPSWISQLSGTGLPRQPTWISLLPGQNSGGVTQVLSGTYCGRPVSVADYSYITGVSNGAARHHLTVAAVQLDTSHPPATVQPRGVLSRLGRSLVSDTYTATGNAEFDERFRISTKHPESTRALIGPALIAEHFSGRPPTWGISGSDLVSWRTGRIDPDQIDGLVAQVVRIADLLGR